VGHLPADGHKDYAQPSVNSPASSYVIRGGTLHRWQAAGGIMAERV